MRSRELSPADTGAVRRRIRRAWDWKEYYFYPLEPCKRDDVLAFSIRRLEKIFPAAAFQALLLELAPTPIQCLWEHDPAQAIDVADFEFAYDYSELAVVDEAMTWLLYWSHEETITLGGEALITLLKSHLPEWQTAVWSTR